MGAFLSRCASVSNEFQGVFNLLLDNEIVYDVELFCVSLPCLVTARAVFDCS